MNELEYFRRRLLQEEEAARNATCQVARDRHEELAEAYRLRSRLIVALPTIALGHATQKVFEEVA